MRAQQTKEEREGELNCAVIDLLDVILDRNLDDVILDRKLSAYAGEDIDDFSDIVEDVKDHIDVYKRQALSVLTTLSKKHFSVIPKSAKVLSRSPGISVAPSRCITPLE